MRFAPMIKSLLDTDLYKFNMDQVLYNKYKNPEGEYHFKCRNSGIRFTPEMVTEINEQIDCLCALKFTEEELKYLSNLTGIKSDYVEFLRKYSPDRKAVKVSLDNSGNLVIIAKGPMYSTMQFEIYILEIVNEVYFRTKYDYNKLLDSARAKLDPKISDLNSGKYDFKFAEFGARRRLSREWQEEMIRRLAEETSAMTGTSNVYFAKKFNLKPIGTFAHEFVQMYQAFDDLNFIETNERALGDWHDEYGGNYGIALTDTLTTDLFLKYISDKNLERFSGFRQDSGDPILWGEKIIEFFHKKGIDPKTKILLFSDSLNFDRAKAIYDRFKNRTNVSFGIGTYLSNDTCVPPLNIVMKLQYVNGKPVAKISDGDEKIMCSDENYLKKIEEIIRKELA